jgi:hypothetical protein
MTILFIAALTAALGVIATPSAASAAPADGYLYAWTGTYRGGHQCRWKGNSTDWSDQGCWNRVESIENRGFAGVDAVLLFWGTANTGPYACLGRGDMWLDLSIHREKFDHVGLSEPKTAGLGSPLENNVTSHYWVRGCP